MKLPNGDQAIVDPRKIIEYCLSADHDDGKHKAGLFHILLGITLEHADLLIDSLRQAARTGDTVAGRNDAYGQRYTVDFEFTGPAGEATIRSAWIIRLGETVPRLVTCYIL
jgi:hypothetical protein